MRDLVVEKYKEKICAKARELDKSDDRSGSPFITTWNSALTSVIDELPPEDLRGVEAMAASLKEAAKDPPTKEEVLRYVSDRA